MRVQRLPSTHPSGLPVVLLDEADQPIAIVSEFLRHLRARDYSPNTLVAYAYDLLHFWAFLHQQHISIHEFSPAQSLDFLEYLRQVPSRRQVQRLGLALCTMEEGLPATRLAATTINRIFAAVSSFYEYLIISGRLGDQENPLLKVDDPARARVSERHRPFLGRASQQRPVRRVVRVKTVQRVPRPLSEEQVQRVVGSLRGFRDRAMLWLMLQGGLRPGDYIG